MNIKKIGVTVGMLVTTSVLLTSYGSSSGITEKSYEKVLKDIVSEARMSGTEGE